MSNKEYCFDVDNPDNIVIDVNSLQAYIRALYVGDGPRFSEDDLPITMLYHEEDGSVCFLVRPAGKKNTKRIEDVNATFTPADLEFEGITLSKPYLYTPDTVLYDPASEISFYCRGTKWDTLRHNGPYFPHIDESYKPLGARLGYENTWYTLSPEEERVARYYAGRILSEEAANAAGKKMGTPGTENPRYRKNFWKDFQTYLRPENKKAFKKMDKIDWSDVKDKITISKEEAKGVAKERKNKEIARKMQVKRKHGIGVLNGAKEEVGNFAVEQPGILQGRGNNDAMGRIKPLIMPADVTINVEEGYTPLPPTGHLWGDVIHDKNVEWLSSYKDKISGDTKYVRFSTRGTLKQRNDAMKYELARKLQLHIDDVRRDYMALVKSSSKSKQQIGCVMYLVDRYGLRVGGGAAADEKDVVGATSLKVGHVKFVTDGVVELDFTGKDSIRFKKQLSLPPTVYKAIRSFATGENRSDDLFDLINKDVVNDYLKTIDCCFTAKLFRTRLASYTMYEALKKVKIPKGTSAARAVTFFKKANTTVANLLNHVKTVSQVARKSVNKLKETLKIKKKELKDNPPHSDKKRKKLKEDIQKITDNISVKSDALSNSITTSQQNYIDPRVPLSWARSNGYELSNFYDKKLTEAFAWAISSTPDGWDYLTSPLERISPELDPRCQRVSAASRDPSQRLADSYEEILAACESPGDVTDAEVYETVNGAPKNVQQTIYLFCLAAHSRGTLTPGGIALLDAVEALESYPTDIMGLNNLSDENLRARVQAEESKVRKNWDNEINAMNTTTIQERLLRRAQHPYGVFKEGAMRDLISKRERDAANAEN